jgi:hypothetical protein
MRVIIDKSFELIVAMLRTRDANAKSGIVIPLAGIIREV